MTTDQTTHTHPAASLTLAAIAKLLNADIFIPDDRDADVVGEQTIMGIAALDSATDGHISFISSAKYRQQLADTQAVAVLVAPAMRADCPVIALVVADPYAAFAKLSTYYEYRPRQPIVNRADHPNDGIDKTATIAATAHIGEGVLIAANVSIGEHVQIGEGTQLAANVVIEDYAVIGAACHLAANVVVHHHCQLGDRVRIHANASIGADGFGFAPIIDEHNSAQPFRWERIAQLGTVRIGNDASIGANTCIDRGALDDTLIGEGVIIDNLVQIAHNVVIGDYTAIAACTGIAGSTTIGKGCIIGGAVSIAGHISIADRVTISGGSNIIGTIKESSAYASGTMHMPTAQWRRATVNHKQLAEHAPKKLAAQIDDLKQRLDALELYSNELS